MIFNLECQQMFKLGGKMLYKCFFQIKKAYLSRIRIWSDPVFFGRPDLDPTLLKPEPDSIKMRLDPQHWHWFEDASVKLRLNKSIENPSNKSNKIPIYT